MKEIIIRMKDTSEVYGTNFDPEEIKAEHTGLEVELDGIQSTFCIPSIAILKIIKSVYK